MSTRRDQLTDQLLAKLSKLGPERVTLAAQLVKLQDEVDEVKLAARGDDVVEILREIADVVVVAHTAARVLGFGSSTLMWHVETKMAVNAKRDWFPTASGTARHTKEVEQ